MEWFDYGKNKITLGIIIIEDRGNVSDFWVCLKFSMIKVKEKMKLLMTGILPKRDLDVELN